jgi:DNA-binding CsgD family transcriptional regulator
MVDPGGGEPRELDRGRQIRFAVTPTGVRVAYATVGRRPALVVPAAWIGHLEITWQDPAVRAFYAPIAACRTVGGLRQAGLRALRPLAGAPDARQRPGSAPDGDRPPGARPGRPAGALDGGAGVAGLRGPAPGTGRAPDAVRRLRRRSPGRLGRGPRGHDRAGSGALGARLGRAGRHLPPRRHGGGQGALRRAATPVHDRRDRLGAAGAVLRAPRRRPPGPRRHAHPVLHRRDDRAIPYRLGRDLAARVPGARLVSLAGRSHWVFAGDAAAVVREILGFLGASHSALPADPAAGPPARLTARQLQVAALVAGGLTNRQIAGRLGIEERSAEGHVERIRKRLGERSRAQIATWWASAHGD